MLSSLTHCHSAEVCSLQFDGIRESRGSWRSSTVEQLICNQQVAGSIPIASSNGEESKLSCPTESRFAAAKWWVMRVQEAGVAEWLKAADCKSAGVMPTVVRTHPPAPLDQGCAKTDLRGSNSVVESRPSKPLVAGSIPVSRSRQKRGICPRSSVVEHVLGKDGVTSSSLVVGSMKKEINNRAGSSPREPWKPENTRGRQEWPSRSSSGRSRT